MLNFYEKYIQLCGRENKSPSKAAEEIGLSRASVNAWKVKGTQPSDLTLSKVAAYFNIPVEYLKSDDMEVKEDIKKDPGNAEVSALDSLFLNGMHQLSPEDQLAVLAYIHSLRNK